MRIGNGYDVHKLVEGRDLILGGEKIDFEKGLLGHSDADVLTHAIMDALLGSISMRDIGYHFPDTDKEYKDINSLILLSRVGKILNDKGYKIINIDSVIAMQKPKLSPHIDKMRKNIAEVLNIDIDLVSIKPTTTEELGFVGKQEGVEAYAVCLVDNI